MLSGIKSRELPVESWNEFCAYYRHNMTNRLESLSDIELPGRNSLAKHYKDATSVLEVLATSNPETLAENDGCFQQLDDAVRKAKILEEHLSKAESGPTNIPSANVLISVLKAYPSDSGQIESLTSILEDYAELLDSYAETFERSASEPVESALIQEEIPRTLEAMDSHYSVIEELGEGLAELTEAKIQSLIERLTQTSTQLEESSEVYTTAVQHQQNILCPSCGRSNPPENRNCEACGQLLPKNEDGASSSTFSILSGPMLEENQQLEMTENVNQLFLACDEVAVGNITDEQFLNELKLAASGLNEFAQELEGIAASAVDESLFPSSEDFEFWRTNHLPYLEDVSMTYDAGIKEVQEGLRSMQSYLDNRDDENLVSGIRLVWQGMSTINRAKLSVETYDATLADAIAGPVDQEIITGEEE